MYLKCKLTCLIMEYITQFHGECNVMKNTCSRKIQNCKIIHLICFQVYSYLGIPYFVIYPYNITKQKSSSVHLYSNPYFLVCTGRFDFIGASHQLWHLIIVAALVYWHQTGLEYAYYRMVFGCNGISAKN